MKEYFVKDLKKNDQFSEEPFVVIKSQKNTARNGSEYYRVELGDKTGSVNGNIWADNIGNCEVENLVEGNIVKAWGKVEEYKGQAQLNITALGLTEDYEDADFMKVTERNPEEMWEEFKVHLAKMEDEDIKGFLLQIFKDKEIAEQYKVHPAAQRVHHEFQHGLLEHVMEMLDLSDVMLKYYPEADASLVKAGIILHDIGKLVELENQKITVNRTVPGGLIGHIIQGYEFVIKNIPEDFPEDKLLKLKHIILSHHGILEYGSPVVPKTLEAVIVSELDDASSKTRQYQKILKANIDNQDDFSARDFILGTEVYLK